MRRAAFTLVEVMILVVVIGLVAAMAIPAFVKVRDGSIVKTVQGGGWDSLNEAQKARYRELVKSGAVTRLSPTVQVVTAAAYPPADAPAVTSPLQTITVGDRRYVLVPKVDAKETEIAGRTYWLVPIQ